MADGHVIAQNQRILVAHHVANRAVLNVGSRADADVVHVPADHRTRPDAGIFADHHVANNHGRRVNVCGSRDLRVLATVWPDVGFSAQNRDRKSTRLNSSHGYISYAVFCLTKTIVTYASDFQPSLDVDA